ncbi:hypothetical protein GCM10009850_093280 [Nonomuraea monospora]|uniref:Uncharacterized protein n=1 Tax=Nonomuraea monospora TaxID=568818 RepID=A0ABP5PQD5_9ACTN
MALFIISSTAVGAIIGCLSHLLVPRRRAAGWVALIGAGVVAVTLAHAVGFADDAWLVLGVEFVLAAACVGVVAMSE